MAGTRTFSHLMAQYGVGADVIGEFCRQVGLPVVAVDAVNHVAVYKPSVIEHPVTGERALSVSFGFIRGVAALVKKAFLRDYGGLLWLPHRVFWKAPWLETFHDRVFSRRVNAREKDAGVLYLTQSSAPLSSALPLTALFSEPEIQLLAASMRRRYSSFIWKEGDILILDNLKIAHNGMAGYGSRELGAMLCNVIRLASSASDAGLYIASPPNAWAESLGLQLTRRGATLSSVH